MMKTSYDCYVILQKDILNGKKIPHKTSFPLLREVDGSYYLAVYVYFYSKEDIISHKGRRPEIWALADLETGNIVKRFSCKERDFSNASFELRYDNRLDSKINLTKDTVMKAFGLLDQIRENLIYGKILPSENYENYLKMIEQMTPIGYRSFCRELSV